MGHQNYIVSGNALRIDPATYELYQTNSIGHILSHATHEGQLPFVAPPGLSAVYMHQMDLEISGLDGDVTYPNRSFTVDFDYSPRERT
jgi:hypothetical protein